MLSQHEILIAGTKSLRTMYDSNVNNLLFLIHANKMDFKPSYE